jgi:hypothetical protein
MLYCVYFRPFEIFTGCAPNFTNIKQATSVLFYNWTYLIDLVPLEPKSKVKTKLSLCFNWAPRHEGVLDEWMYGSNHSLTSALDGGEWSASRPGRFTPKEGALGTHWIGGWVGPRAVLDAVVKKKIPSPCRESNPTTPIIQLVAQRYTEWATTALKQYLNNYYI